MHKTIRLKSIRLAIRQCGEYARRFSIGEPILTRRWNRLWQDREATRRLGMKIGQIRGIFILMAVIQWLGRVMMKVNTWSLRTLSLLSTRIT